MHWASISLFAGLAFSSFSLLITCSPTNHFAFSGGAPQYEISKQDRLLKRAQEAPASPHVTFQSLRRRTLVDDLGEGWEMFLTHAENFFPIPEAAADLRDFYIFTITKASDYMMMNHEQYNSFAFRSGNLAMTWRCSRSNIPWIFVHTFALQMLQATYRGFTAQFSMHFRHTHGLVIDVMLQVLPVAAQSFHGST